MIYEKNVGADEVARAISRIIETGRESLDWAALFRAVAAFRQEQVEGQRYRAACRAWDHDDCDDEDLLSAPTNDPQVLAVKLNSIVLGSVVRFGEASQKLIEGYAPEMRRRLEEHESSVEPSESAKFALIDGLRVLLQDWGAMVREQASQVERDLWKIQEELLPHDNPYR